MICHDLISLSSLFYLFHKVECVIRFQEEKETTSVSFYFFTEEISWYECQSVAGRHGQLIDAYDIVSWVEFHRNLMGFV